MNEETYYIIVGAIVGSFTTITIQAISYFVKRTRVKRSLNDFLREVTLPICSKIKKESALLKGHLDSKTYGDLTFGMHPALNSEILKTYSLDEIKSAYGNNMPVFIGVISMIDNLSGRTPLIHFNNLVAEVNLHITESNSRVDNNKEAFDSYDDHFKNCEAVQQMRDRTKINLNHIDKIVNELEIEIKKLKK